MLRRLRPLARDLLCDALSLGGLLRPRADRLTVATFHRVLPEAQRSGYPLAGLAVTPGELSFFGEAFRRRYTCGTLADVAARWHAGERPERPFLALTFDDGQRDGFEHGRPVLEALGLRATFFVPARTVGSPRALWHDRLAFAAQRVAERQGTGALAVLLGEAGATRAAAGLPGEPLGAARAVVLASKALPAAARERLLVRCEERTGGPVRPEWDALMDWDELATLAREGHEIGCHGGTHALLPSCDDETLADEVQGSRRLLRDRLGLPVESFCYPNGEWDARVLSAVERAGYRWAVTTAHGTNGEGAHPLRLLRCDMVAAHVRRRSGELSDTHLLRRLAGGPVSRR